jgi:hypothetical protein
MALLGILLSAAIVVTLVALLRPDSNEQPDQTTTSVDAADMTSTTLPTTGTSAVATSPTTATTQPTTTTLGDPLAALTLNETGIGDINFGSDADDTVAQLSLVLGSPTEDTGWTPSFETCPGTEARVVRWTSLQAFFTNGSTEWAPEGTPHFFHWSQSVLAGGGVLLELYTSNGIGIRSTLGELAAAYQQQVTITDDPIFGPFWEVDGAGPGVLWGTAGAIGDNGMIDSINGGSGCGE